MRLPDQVGEIFYEWHSVANVTQADTTRQAR